MTIQKKAELTGHGNPVFTLELSQKPGILFTGGNDKGVVEWSLKNSSFIKVLFPVTASVYALHAPVDFPFLFAGLRNGSVSVFDFNQQKLPPPLRHHTKPIFDIKSVKNKQELLVGSEDGTVSVWGLQTLELLHTIKVAADTIRCISISPDATRVAFGCRDNNIYVYDLHDYAPIAVLKGHTMPVFALQYAPDGTYLVSGGRDAQLKVWDAKSFELIQNIPAHLFAINCIAFQPHLPYFATASMDKTIKIWDAHDFKLRKTISREKGMDSHILSVNKIAWNGNDLLSTGDDKKIIIWSVEIDS